MQVIICGWNTVWKIKNNSGVISDAQFTAHNCKRATQLLDLQQNGVKDGDQNTNICTIHSGYML